MLSADHISSASISLCFNFINKRSQFEYVCHVKCGRNNNYQSSTLLKTSSSKLPIQRGVYISGQTDKMPRNESKYNISSENY